jgi:ligand-binding sensor domain-containing protein/signal transduction histidine kinase
MKNHYISSFAFLSIASLLLLHGCLFPQRDVPFPSDSDGSLSSKSGSLSWGPQNTVTWDVPDPRGIAAPSASLLSWNALPSVVVDMAEFKPFSAPLSEESYSIVEEPLTVCDFNALPVQTVTFTPSLLGLATRIPGGSLNIADLAARGVLHIDADQGLPGSACNAMLRDHQDRLWVATAHGLWMDDGEYGYQYSTLQGLASNDVTALLEDAAGRIWVGTRSNGIDVIDAMTGTINHADTRQGLQDQRICGLAGDSRQQLWISTQSGLSILDPQRGRLKHLGPGQGLSGVWNDAGKTVAEDAGGAMWIATPKGIDILSTANGTLARVRLKSGMPIGPAAAILRAADGSVCVGARGGADAFDPSTKRVRHFGPAQGLLLAASCIAQDGRGRLWFGTAGAGALVADAAEMRSTAYGTREGLSDNTIASLECDSAGVVWIGTQSHFLSLLEPFGSGLMHFGAPNGLRFGSVTGIAADTSRWMLVGSAGLGLVQVDRVSGTASTATIFATELRKGPAGEVWAATRNGVCIIAPSRQTARTLDMRHGLGSADITCTMQTRGGAVWIGTNGGGATVADSGLGHPKRLRAGSGLGSDVVTALLEDAGGAIWIGTNAGVDVFDPGSGTIRHAVIRGLRDDAAIAALFEDSHGRIWIGTDGNGLAILEAAKGTATRVTATNGLPGMFVGSFAERDGKMYCGTSSGLCLVTVQDNNGLALRNFGRAEGFPKLTFNTRAVAVAPDGALWWGVGDLLTRMPPNVEADERPRETRVTGMEIMDRRESFATQRWLREVLARVNVTRDLRRSAAPPPVPDAKDGGTHARTGITWSGIEGPYQLPRDLVLPWDQDHVRFSFTGSQLTHRRASRYRFILEGADSKWSATTDAPFADFRNLSSGSYAFKVRSRGFSGRWSAPAVFRFTVAPPPWRTWWAFAISAVALFAAVFLASRLQRRRVLRRELAAARAREAALRDSVVQAESAREEHAQAMASELETTRRALVESRAHLAHNPVGKGEKRDVDLNHLLEECVQAAFHAMCATAPDFRCAIMRDFYPELPALRVIPQDVSLAFHHLLRNAFQAVDEKRRGADTDSSYAPAVGVRTAMRGDAVIVSIRDNGTGIAAGIRARIFDPYFTTRTAGDAAGLGLSQSNEIVTAHGGTIAVGSKEGIGSEFLVTLPLA